MTMLVVIKLDFHDNNLGHQRHSGQIQVIKIQSPTKTNAPQ